MRKNKAKNLKQLQRRNESVKTTKLIEQTYFNPKHSASFSGKNKLQHSLRGKVNSKEIVKWLNSTDSYTLHKPVRKRFPRRKYIVSGIDGLWQADLSDMTRLNKSNDNNKFILVIIDTFSRKAYSKLLKTKSGQEVSKAFKSVIVDNNVFPKDLLTDKGKEFYNSFFKDMLAEYKINHYSSNNQEIKASMVERFQRTLKSKIFRYITHSNSNRYCDILQDIILSYNNSTHRAHNMKPNDVDYNNQEEVWQRLYNQEDPNLTKYKFKVDDKVRISKYSTVFSKNYLPLWTQEIFTISKAHKTSPPVYSLKDDLSNDLEGTWYEPELQKVLVKDDTYKIESIISQRKLNGKIQYLVRWEGYPPSFDSYIDKNALMLNYKN